MSIKSLIACLPAVLIFAFTSSAFASNEAAAESVTENLVVSDSAKNALEIMDKVNNRYVGDDAKSLLTLDYMSGSGRSKSMTLHLRSREIEAGSQTLLKFKEPAFMKGSGILIHSYDEKDNLQWLYLSKASKKEPRKIASSDKGKPLFGTDFYYVDIEPKATLDFTYQWLKEESLNDRMMYVIQAVPVKEDYPYDKTISWVDPETHIEMKIDYYQDNQHIKTLTVAKTEKIEGIWTVTEAVMNNHNKSSKTAMKVSDMDYNVGLKKKVFSFKSLTAKELR